MAKAFANQALDAIAIAGFADILFGNHQAETSWAILIRASQEQNLRVCGAKGRIGKNRLVILRREQTARFVKIVQRKTSYAEKDDDSTIEKGLNARNEHGANIKRWLAAG